MGKGIDMARAAGAGIHADVLDDFKDQLLVCLLKRLMDKHGRVRVTAADVDATGDSVVAFSADGTAFNFEVKKKS